MNTFTGDYFINHVFLYVMLTLIANLELFSRCVSHPGLSAQLI